MDMDMPSSSSTPTQIENAFVGLAPSYPASKSTEPWDIFINHCGKDVKHTLATAIYHKLHSLGFHVFLDKGALHPGDSFPAEIQHAIATATFHIAIFSPNYADSPWCLAELSLMLKTGAKIIRIFWNVEPSELRWIDQGKGKKKYATAFLEHENKGRYTQEQLAEWRNSLSQISSLHGYVVKDNKDEATVLKNVVNFSLQIMKKTPLWVAAHPLGLDELVRGFDSVSSKEGVRITGIVGMGGSGKTTLAKELYNRKFSSFQRCSFVSDVRDAAARNALCEKQKKLLLDLGLHQSSFDHVDEGKVILANHLRSHQVLIVLDDVDCIDQLNALLPIKKELGSQSIVIITTRELGVLRSWDLDSIYHIPALADPHAKQLFCWHAFLQHSPPAEFEILVKGFLEACNGLPLSLKVMGAQLYARTSKDYWESQLNKVKRILPEEIQKRLRVSYDALDEEEKEMFLDSACFFIGEEKSRVVAAWDGSGWSGLHGLETLVNKCLLELQEGGKHKDNSWPKEKRIVIRMHEGWKPKDYSWPKEKRIVIRMHDHLRDMGRVIASRQSPYRLWYPQPITNLKKDSMIRKQIRGIHPVATEEYMKYLMANASEQSDCLAFSNELQILSVDGKVNIFKKKFAALWANLVWLRWTDSPLRSIPSWLTFKNLRVLELSAYGDTEVKLWADNADLPLQLRELILHGYSVSSFRHLQHLKRLDASCCKISLSEEFCGLQSLELLQLHNSYELSSLPVSFGNLTSLRYLDLSNSNELCFLPDSFSQLIYLEDLNLSDCRNLSSLPSDFGNLRSLRNVNLENCWQLIMLPDSFTQLIYLEDLDLSDCYNLSSLPSDFGNLRSLRNVNLKNCWQLIMLPDSFTQLIYLENLGLFSCWELSSLPSDFGKLRSLRNVNLQRCSRLIMLPDSFTQLIYLENLDLSGCMNLSSLPSDFGNLRRLRKVDLENCWQLIMLPDSFTQLTRLETLVLTNCEELRSLPFSLDLLINLERFYVKGALYLGEIESLPVSLKFLRIDSCEFLKNISCISGLRKLETLEIFECPEIEEFPSFAELVSLRVFEMEFCPKVEKIEGFENAKSLKTLEVHSRWRVRGMESLENVERLEWVHLECENNIKDVTRSILSIKGKEFPMHVQIGGGVEDERTSKYCLEFFDVAAGGGGGEVVPSI